MKIKNLVCFIAVITTSFLTCAYADDLSKTVIITNAWVQAVPPSQSTSAAYMIITNNSFNEIVLESVSSDAAGTVEVHKMTDMNGMMGMAQITKPVHIPALGKFIAQPGRFHFMLINLKKPLNKGDIVPIVLHFQGGDVAVNAEVKMQDADNSSGMAGMKM